MQSLPRGTDLPRGGREKGARSEEEKCSNFHPFQMRGWPSIYRVSEVEDYIFPPRPLNVDEGDSVISFLHLRIFHGI
jgi:hypothetical protein